MHIPDGFLSWEVCSAGYLVSAAATVYAVKQLKKETDEKIAPLMGVTAAFIFAAQMLNFPVAGGASGHFLGALLAMLMMGPWAGLLMMDLVLLVQCLGFADGGLTALGANTCNMGIVGGLSGYLVFKLVSSILRQNQAMMLLAGAIAAWFSVFAASAFCAMELAISGAVAFKIVFPAMTIVHSLIGIGEALITTAVLGMVLNYRPDIVKVAAIRIR